MTRDSILVIARDTDVREAFRGSLSARGWRAVESCESTAEAVRMLESGAFGLAVLHADVADMTGLQALPILGAVEPRVKILFATADTTMNLEARARELGIFYYYIYSRPDSDELAAAVQFAVGPPPWKRPVVHTVLIVDDDAGFARAVRSFLEPHGFRVLAATNVGDGLRLARAERPGLILLDIVMESATDGLALSNEIRRDPQLRHTPMLAVSAIGGRGGSGYSRREDEGLLPVDGFMEKPIVPDALLKRVRALLGEGEAT